MLGEAYQANKGRISESRWNQEWGNLTGGTILINAMRRYMDGGTLTATEKSGVITRISASTAAGCELAENLLVRLCGCVSRGRISLKTAKATLRCKHFRTNLSLHEIRQFIDCWKILQGSSSSGGTSLSLATELLECLQHQPYSMAEESEYFEYAFPAGLRENFEAFIESHGIDKFTLFLQEYAGEQPFVTLERGQ